MEGPLPLYYLRPLPQLASWVGRPKCISCQAAFKQGDVILGSSVSRLECIWKLDGICLWGLQVAALGWGWQCLLTSTSTLLSIPRLGEGSGPICLQRKSGPAQGQPDQHQKHKGRVSANSLGTATASGSKPQECQKCNCFMNQPLLPLPQMLSHPGGLGKSTPHKPLSLQSTSFKARQAPNSATSFFGAGTLSHLHPEQHPLILH